MRNFAVAAGLAVSLSASFGVNPSFAFGGCGRHAIECYDKVRLPDVYATRSRPVLVSPGWQSYQATQPIIRNVAVPVLVRSGRWHTVLTPPVYGMGVRRVMVSPPRRSYEFLPPVTRRIAQTVVVSPGGVRWERSHSLFGHERICKVATPPVTQTVVRDVVVSPPRRIVRFAPALYADVARPVMVRPPMAQRFYEPPVHAIMSQSVVVRPSYLRSTYHPPVYGVAKEQVLIRSGGYAWRRAGSGSLHSW